MRILNLDSIRVHSLITDNDKTVEAVVTQDYNGQDNVTVFYTGIPIIIAEVPSSPQDMWEWHALRDTMEESRNQVHIDILFEIGELSEEDYDRYISGVPGRYEALSWQAYEVALESQGDGHEWIALMEIIEDAYYGRSS